jgi:hypothetical protein
MAEHAADDFSVISRRLREIETEQGVLPPGCTCTLIHPAENGDRYRILAEACPVHGPRKEALVCWAGAALAADRFREETESAP